MRLPRLRNKEGKGEEALVLYPVWACDESNPLTFLVRAEAYEKLLERYLRDSYELETLRISVPFRARREAARLWRIAVKKLRLGGEIRAEADND